MILAIGLSFVAWLVKGRRRVGARGCAPRLAPWLSGDGGGTSPDEGEGSGATTSLARADSRSGAKSEPPRRATVRAYGRRYGAKEHCKASLSRMGEMSSGNHLRRSPTWRPVGLPGLRRLTVRAGDRRRHRRQEQIAAVAGIRSAVHRTAGRARPLDAEVTRRGCLAELASRRRRGAGRP